jgi:hypothetical protein
MTTPTGSESPDPYRSGFESPAGKAVPTSPRPSEVADQAAVLPQWSSQPAYAAPAVAPRSDSTRVIAIIALVLAALSMAVAAFGQFVPFLFLGAFGGPGDGGFFPPGDGVGGFTGTVHRGSVTVEADTVSAASLSSAVSRATKGELFDPVTCDPVPRVTADATVLCRSTVDAIHTYAVVRFIDDTGRFEVMVFTYESGSEDPTR